MSTQTEVREQTDTGLDDVLYHEVCPECYPENYLGMLALCGQELLGIVASSGSPCPRCREIEECSDCGYPLRALQEFWFGTEE